MKVSEFRRFRSLVVNALEEHPAWKKVHKPNGHILVPRNHGARTYWRIRNGTQNLARKYANFDETASICLGNAYNPSGDYELDPQDARCVLKWKREFAELNHVQLERNK